MKNIINAKNFSWIDMGDPSEKDFEFIKKEYNVHPVILEELKQSMLRPKVEDYKDYLYLVLHFPQYDRHKKTSVSKEIDFIITKKDIITFHSEPIIPLDEFIKILRSNANEKYMEDNNIIFLYYLLKQFYDFELRQLDHIHKKIESLEEKIYNNHEKEILKNVFFAKRDLLDFRRLIKPQRNTLTSLSIMGPKCFGEDSYIYFNKITGCYLRVWTVLENHKETIDSLYEMNYLLLNNKNSQTMKTLTMIATIIFPLTLIVGLFSTNFVTPFTKNPMSFWYLSLVIIAAALFLIVYFKKKDWF